MCEFCHKHGEGKKWYLQAKNYSEDLLSDLKRRQVFRDVLAYPISDASMEASLGSWEKAPRFVKSVMAPFLIRQRKNTHFGQVVPIEEVEKIFDFSNSVVRLACVCRQGKLGNEQRYCYGVSMSPDGGEMAKIIQGLDVSYLNGPDAVGLEKLTREEALKSFQEHEKEGLCHTVWTFKIPFVGGICNCDRSDCGAMRAMVNHGFPSMFRAEFVARLNPEICSGCRQCMRVCQFGAIGYSAATKKAYIDQNRCYGCGICRASCAKNAIELLDRSSVPAVANKWL